jgi:hypothetical protein
MQVRVQNALASDGIREHARRRMEMATDGFHEHIEQITVDLHYVGDIHEPHDKVCRLSVELRPLGRLDVTSTDMHFASAIDTAARKLRFRLDEKLGHGNESVELQNTSETVGSARNSF